MKDDDDNIVDVLFIQLTWLEIDAYLEWLIELELWKLKSESKDLLLVAFRQNKLLQPKSLACLDKLAKYTNSRVSLTEY